MDDVRIFVQAVLQHSNSPADKVSHSVFSNEKSAPSCNVAFDQISPTPCYLCYFWWVQFAKRTFFIVFNVC